MLTDDMVVDIKTRLDVMDSYGYESDPDFVAALESAIEDAAIEFMIPALGDSECSRILDIDDKSNLAEDDRYLYRAFVEFSTGIFLRVKGHVRTQNRQSSSISYQQNGVSRTDTGMNGLLATSGYYIDCGIALLNQSGYYYSMQISRAGLTGEWVRPGEVK